MTETGAPLTRPERPQAPELPLRGPQVAVRQPFYRPVAFISRALGRTSATARHEGHNPGHEREMADLSNVLEAAMRRRHLGVQPLVARTGSRTPRIRVFIQDGTEGPIHPTEQALRELAHAFGLPVSEVLPGAALVGAAGL